MKFGFERSTKNPSPASIGFRSGDKIRAVQRIAHFQTQGIARAKPAWFDSKLFTAGQSEAPKFRSLLSAKEDFHSVFSGVARPRDRDRHVVDS